MADSLRVIQQALSKLWMKLVATSGRVSFFRYLLLDSWGRSVGPCMPAVWHQFTPKARYDLDCVESAIKPQPTVQHQYHWCCNMSFFVDVQSYAGKYIPALASRIHRDRPQPAIYLRGIAIGDGWSDPPVVRSLSLVIDVVKIHYISFFITGYYFYELAGSACSGCN